MPQHRPLAQTPAPPNRPTRPDSSFKTAPTIDLSDPALGTLTIGHDLDGCYFWFTRAFCTDQCELDPANAELYMSQANPADHAFFRTFGWEPSDFVARYDEAMSRGLLTRTEFTYPGSVRALDRLTETFGRRLRNEIITYRENGLDQFDGATQTAEWALAVKFPFTSLVSHKDKRVLHADYFIEDTVANYRSLREAGTACFLRAQPWNNYGADVPSEHVVDSIEEFVDKVIAAELRRLGVPEQAA